MTQRASGRRARVLRKLGIAGVATLLASLAVYRTYESMDTVADIFPDPADRTRLCMELLQRRADQRRQNGAPHPKTLDALVEQSASESKLECVDDAWGRRFDYRPVDRAFELRSAGPDGAMETADDLAIEIPRW